MLKVQDKLNTDPIQLEQKILKAIFKRNDSILDIIDIVKPEMFSLRYHADIYSAMIELFKEDSSINIETVTMWLQNKCINYDINIIEKLYNESYTSLKIKDTAIILKELFLRKQMLVSVRELLENQEQTPTTSDDILEKINNIAMKANENVIGEEYTSGKCCDNIDILLNKLEDKLSNASTPKGIEVGIPVIDNELDSLQRKKLWTIVADSQVGKSALAIQLATQACIYDPNIHVSYYSLEMDKAELEERFLSNVTNIEPRYIANPLKYFSRFDSVTGEIVYDVSEEEVQKFKQEIVNGAQILKDFNIHIDDSGDLDLVSFEAKVKKNHLKWGRTDIIIIDHVGILCDGTPSETVGKMDLAYKKFKQIAKKLNCVVIALHQFSNELKNDPVRFPNIFSLRGSSAPRHYSDIIMGIYRPSVYPDIIKNHPEIKDVCQLVWQKVRYTAKPENTDMDYNGFRFIQSEPQETKGEPISGRVYLDDNGVLIGEQ